MNNINNTYDTNTKAVQAMFNEANKSQPIKTTMKNCEQILSKAFNEEEKKLGRPMTYAEMRERFG